MTERAVLFKNLKSGINEESIKQLLAERGVDGHENVDIKMNGGEALLICQNDDSIDGLLCLDGLELLGSALNVVEVENLRDYLSNIPEIINSEPVEHQEHEKRGSKENDDTHKSDDDSKKKKKHSEDSDSEKDEKKTKKPEEKKIEEQKPIEKEWSDEEVKNEKVEEKKVKEELKHHEKHVEFKENPVIREISNDNKLAKAKSSNVSLGYKDILSVLQQTNVPSREPLPQNDAFKESIGNRTYLLSTITVWSVLWVLGNMFL